MQLNLPLGKQAKNSRLIIQAVTSELFSHLAVLLLVLTPILMIVFPAMLLIIGTSLLASLWPDNQISQWLHTEQWTSFAVTYGIIVLVGIVSIWWVHRHNIDKTPGLRALAGESGRKLTEMVKDMWDVIGRGKPLPDIRWFPALDIAAYADLRKKYQELQVSAGLWRSAINDEPIAKAIISHELAHLVYRDPYLIRILNFLVTAIRGVLLFTTVLGGIIVSFLLFHETYRAIEQHAGIVSILNVWGRVLAIASFLLLLIPLCGIAIRRQVAFVTSLIEIRADLIGAEWTGGLQAYTQIFASHRGVIRTSGQNYVKALLSPYYSHIPQRERMLILQTPSLLVTPKLAFFFLSVLLAFILPINFATPYLLGGFINYLVIQMVVSTLNATIIIMLVLGSSDKTVDVPYCRLFILAAVSCIVTALPRINLEALSYLPVSWFAGFAGKPMDPTSISEGVSETASDLIEKFSTGLINTGTAFAILIAFFAIIGLKHSASTSSAWLNVRLIIAVIFTVVGSFIAGFDSWRADDLPGSDLLQAITTNFSFNYSLLLSLPILCASLIDNSILLFRKLSFQLRS